MSAPGGKTSWEPSPKLQAAGAWGATAVVIGYALREWLHVEIPDAVWLSAGVVVTWLGGYLKREKPKP